MRPVADRRCLIFLAIILTHCSASTLSIEEPSGVDQSFVVKTEKFLRKAVLSFFKSPSFGRTTSVTDKTDESHKSKEVPLAATQFALGGLRAHRRDAVPEQAPAETTYVRGNIDGTCPAGSNRATEETCRQLGGSALEDGTEIIRFDRTDCAVHFAAGAGCFISRNGVAYNTAADCPIAAGNDGQSAVCVQGAPAPAEAFQRSVDWNDILANDDSELESTAEVEASENYALFYGALHDVVGEDGVLMIHLEPQTSATTSALRSNHRRNVTSKALAEAGIIPTSFPATDAQAAAAEDLKLGCLQSSHPDTHRHCSGSVREPDVNKHIQMGQGCTSSVEQAIADSHRRALIAAQERDHAWTAIIEDDVAPSISSEWGEKFAKAWAHIPPEAKFVRLGWCTFGEDVGPINQHISYDDGTFRIIDWMSLQNNWYYTGGCTTGYIVHNSIIPDLLKIFPCCSPIDTCLEQEFFYSPPFCRQDMSCLGRDIMVSLDALGSTSYAAGRTMLKQQAGVLIQDNSRIRSSRPKFNQTS